MPDVIRHPVSFWIPAYAGMTILGYLTAGVISNTERRKRRIGRRVLKLSYGRTTNNLTPDTRHGRDNFSCFHSFVVGYWAFVFFLFKYPINNIQCPRIKWGANRRLMQGWTGCPTPYKKLSFRTNLVLWRDEIRTRSDALYRLSYICSDTNLWLP